MRPPRVAGETPVPVDAAQGLAGGVTMPVRVHLRGRAEGGPGCPARARAGGNRLYL